MSKALPPKDCKLCGRKTQSGRHHYCEDLACQHTKTQQIQHRFERRQRQMRLDAGEEFVVCAVCGESLLSQSSEHLKTHGFTFADYRARFPEAEVFTKAVRAAKGKSASARASYHTYEGRAPDSLLFEFLTGALLGDGSLECFKVNARYAEGGANQAYISWKADFLRQYVSCAFKFRLSSPHTKSGKRYPGWWARTTVHPVLTEWRNRWYPEGVKTVSIGLVERYLTPFALAVWFYDDGHRDLSSRAVNPTSFFYTHAFTEDEVEFLASLIQQRFALRSRIRFTEKQQPFLQLGAAEWVKLQALLEETTSPGMSYKWQIKHERSPRLCLA
jgi:LAGLIDADG DNA endonuclease family protein